MCLRFLLSAKAFAKFFPPTASQLTSLCEAGISILKPATGRYMFIIIIVYCFIHVIIVPSVTELI